MYKPFFVLICILWSSLLWGQNMPVLFDWGSKKVLVFSAEGEFIREIRVEEFVKRIGTSRYIIVGDKEHKKGVLHLNGDTLIPFIYDRISTADHFGTVLTLELAGVTSYYLVESGVKVSDVDTVMASYSFFMAVKGKRITIYDRSGKLQYVSESLGSPGIRGFAYSPVLLQLRFKGEAVQTEWIKPRPEIVSDLGSQGRYFELGSAGILMPGDNVVAFLDSSGNAFILPNTDFVDIINDSLLLILRRTTGFELFDVKSARSVKDLGIYKGYVGSTSEVPFLLFYHKKKYHVLDLHGQLVCQIPSKTKRYIASMGSKIVFAYDSIKIVDVRTCMTIAVMPRDQGKGIDIDYQNDLLLLTEGFETVYYSIASGKEIFRAKY